MLIKVRVFCWKFGLVGAGGKRGLSRGLEQNKSINQIKTLPVGRGGAAKGAAEIKAEHRHPGEHGDAGEVSLRQKLYIYGIVIKFYREFRNYVKF